MKKGKKGPALALAFFLLPPALGQAQGLWEEVPFEEALRGAELVAEVEVLSGSLFQADLLVRATFKGEGPRIIRLSGANSYYWNASYHALRAGETYFLLLERAGDLYYLSAPASGKFPLERGQVIGCIAHPPLRHALNPESFRRALRDCVKAQAGGKLSDEELNCWRARLADERLEERHLSAEVLAILRDERAAPELIPACRDENPKIRLSAARALARLPPLKLVELEETLRALLAEQERAVALAAARAWLRHEDGWELKPFGEWLARQGQELKLKDPEGRAEVLSFLERAGDRALPELSRLIGAGVLERDSLRVLARIGTVEAIKLLSKDLRKVLLVEEARGGLFRATLSRELYEGQLTPEKWLEVNGARTPAAWRSEAVAAARKKLTGELSETERKELWEILALSGSKEGLGALAQELYHGRRVPALALATWAEAASTPWLALPLFAFYLSGRDEEEQGTALRSLEVLARGEEGWREELTALALPFLDSEDAALLRQALAVLQLAPGERALPRLVEMLSSNSYTQRAEAFAALRRLTSRHFGYSPRLAGREQEEAVARWKLWAAQEQRAAAARVVSSLPPILSGFLDRRVDQPLVQLWEFWTLRPRLLPDKVPWIEERLQARPPEPETCVLLQALGQIRCPEARAVLRRLAGGKDDLARLARRELFYAPELPAEELLAFLDYPDYALLAARELARREERRGMEKLLALLAASDRFSWQDYLKPLAEMVSARDAPRLAFCLAPNHPPHVRVAAGYLLWTGLGARDPGFGAPKPKTPSLTEAVRPALISALQDSESSVRYYAALVLGQAGERAAAKVLYTLLADPDPDVRLASAWALAKLGDKRALAPAKLEVERMPARLVDPRWLEALARVGEAEEAEMLAKLAQGEKTSGGRDFFTRYAAVGALGLSRQDAARLALFAIWKNPEEALAEEAEKAILALSDFAAGELVKELSSTDRARRRSAARLLAELALLSAKDTYLSLVADSDPAVAYYADKALARLTGKESLFRYEATEEERAKAREKWRKAFYP